MHFPFRYNNDRLTRWDDSSASSSVSGPTPDATSHHQQRRNLDFDRYGLRFSPVTSDDSGTFLCLLNNRREPDAPIVLTVQGMYYFLLARPFVVFMILLASGCC